MDKLKVFISMPMKGKSKSEIDEAFKAKRRRMIMESKRRLNNYDF